MPKLDRRTKEDLEAQILRLASSYTPEWRFQKENPDIGSVLASLFAKLTEETIQTYNHMPRQNQRRFLDMLGVEPLPAKAAEGYVIFQLAKPELPETVVKAGTEVAANGGLDGLIRYEVLEDVYVTAATVKLVRAEKDTHWYLCFDRVPNSGVIQLLFSLNQEGELEEIGIEWEYANEGGWNPLQVEDLTDGFRHTGIVRFVKSFEWNTAVVCEKLGYWIRMGRGDGSPLPFGNVLLWVNAAPVRARQVGKQTNLSPNSELRLTKQVGYVSGVFNPIALVGGTGDEQVSYAVTRGSARIHHQFKAVTPRDFEGLVYEQYPDAIRVTCFAGYDRNGIPKTGAVTVVVLSEEDREERRYFYRKREQLTEYLSRYASEILVQRGALSVVAPVPIPIHMQCELCVGSYREVQQIQRQAGEVMSKFLHPITGNYDGTGWELGEIPDYAQIRACFLGIPCVRYIKTLRIAYEMETEAGKQEVLWEQLKRLPWGLPEAGTFQIQVTVEGNYGDVF